MKEKKMCNKTYTCDDCKHGHIVTEHRHMTVSDNSQPICVSCDVKGIMMLRKQKACDELVLKNNLITD